MRGHHALAWLKTWRKTWNEYLLCEQLNEQQNCTSSIIRRIYKWASIEAWRSHWVSSAIHGMLAHLLSHLGGDKMIISECLTR